MGRRGPRPKPTALRILEGNARQHSLPPHEPKPPTLSGPVPAPAFLDTRARAEWARLAPQLETLGVLTAVDRSALELYCDTYARWRELRCDLARWRRDRVKRDQAWRLEAALDRVAALLRQLMAEFGLTPAARTRIEADEPLPPAQPTKTGTETSKAAVARFFRD